MPDDTLAHDGGEDGLTVAVDPGQVALALESSDGEDHMEEVEPNVDALAPKQKYRLRRTSDPALPADDHGDDGEVKDIQTKILELLRLFVGLFDVFLTGPTSEESQADYQAWDVTRGNCFD